MKMVRKNESKKGFSLLETVLVIGIICILASSVIVGGIKLLHKLTASLDEAVGIMTVAE